jgi:hypothetical protein
MHSIVETRACGIDRFCLSSAMTLHKAVVHVWLALVAASDTETEGRSAEQPMWGSKKTQLWLSLNCPECPTMTSREQLTLQWYVCSHKVRLRSQSITLT